METFRSPACLAEAHGPLLHKNWFPLPADQPRRYEFRRKSDGRDLELLHGNCGYANTNAHADTYANTDAYNQSAGKRSILCDSALSRLFGSRSGFGRIGAIGVSKSLVAGLMPIACANDGSAYPQLSSWNWSFSVQDHLFTDFTKVGWRGDPLTRSSLLTGRRCMRVRPLESDKQALALAFAQRNEFLIRYAQSTDATSFVNQLISSIQASSNINLESQRTALTNRYNAGGNLNQSRAFALREAIDTTAFMDGEYNRAFVLMQYFGYLRRDPDDGGYNFWLGIVNNPSAANYRSMVCAFLTSSEYQQRFSSHVPRNDSECANIN